MFSGENMYRVIITFICMAVLVGCKSKTKDGNIFYKKCVLKYELEFCEELIYPKEYKVAVEPIVKKNAAFDVTTKPDLDE